MKRTFSLRDWRTWRWPGNPRRCQAASTSGLSITQHLAAVPRPHAAEGIAGVGKDNTGSITVLGRVHRDLPSDLTMAQGTPTLPRTPSRLGPGSGPWPLPEEMDG